MTGTFDWRHATLITIALGAFLLLFALPPIPQNPAYHTFADTRLWFGIPNFLNVASNAIFLLVGAAGIRVTLSRPAWLVLFVGVTCVGIGSAYYHWQPSSATLVWDRLPMTVGFMGLFSAVIGESVDARFGRAMLAPAVAIGISSVLWWVWFGDLRFYAWVQFVPLATILIVLVLYDPKHTHRWLLGAAIFWYMVAKLFEHFDAGVFGITGGVVSGHTLKHLSAAVGCVTILWMLKVRTLRVPDCACRTGTSA